MYDKHVQETDMATSTRTVGVGGWWATVNDSLWMSARAVLWTQTGIAVVFIVVGAVEGLLS